jgi:hypothetical protein
MPISGNQQSQFFRRWKIFMTCVHSKPRVIRVLAVCASRTIRREATGCVRRLRRIGYQELFILNLTQVGTIRAVYIIAITSSNMTTVMSVKIITVEVAETLSGPRPDPIHISCPVAKGRGHYTPILWMLLHKMDA